MAVKEAVLLWCDECFMLVQDNEPESHCEHTLVDSGFIVWEA